MANVKEKVKTLIEAEKTRLGSYSAVAEKCGVSEAIIRFFRRFRAITTF